MQVYGELIRAQLEVLSATPSSALSGRILWQSTVGKMYVDDGVTILPLLRNDQKCVFGTNATASTNVRWNRSGVATLQLVTGDDTTAEGSSSSSWAKLNTKLGGSLVDTFLDVTETTSPASPAASTRRLFVKSDGGLWSRNSSGTDSQLAVPGISSRALGDLQYGSGANTVAALAGNITANRMVLSQTGTGAVSAAPIWVGPGFLRGTVQTFSANGTWTKPAGCVAVLVEVLGGGGGSGGTTTTGVAEASESGGGGGGGYSRRWITSGLGATETVTVGAAGAAGATAGGTGGTGGTTSFGTWLSATGGTGGGGSTTSATATIGVGGTGGTGATGDLNILGSDGGHGRTITGNRMITCYGGASFMAGSRRAPSAAGAGTAGKAFGGGASGTSISASTSSVAGAAGEVGIVIVHEFY